MPPTTSPTLSQFESTLKEFTFLVSLADAPDEWLASNRSQITTAMDTLSKPERSNLAWLADVDILYPVSQVDDQVSDN
jgi:hypothetical protein